MAGSQELIDYLRAYARSCVFSCSISPPVAGGVLAALRLVQQEPQLRHSLWRNVSVMREALEQYGINTGHSTSQVIPVMINDDVRIFGIVRELIAEGVYLNPVRYPAVSVRRSRLRLAISASHDPAELKEGAATIARVLRRNGVLQ